jgi:hypothetical protein
VECAQRVLLCTAFSAKADTKVIWASLGPNLSLWAGNEWI